MKIHTVRPRRRVVPIVAVLCVLVAAFALAEIALIFVLANLAGWLVTILIVLVTAIVGAAMIRMAGAPMLRRFQAEFLAGRFPGEAIAEGAVILVGGALLMAPGPMTDLIGISTLIPQVRRLYARVIVRYAARTFVGMPLGGAMGSGFTTTPGPQAQAPGDTTGPTVFAVPPDVEDAVPPRGEKSEAVDVEFRRTE